MIKNFSTIDLTKMVTKAFYELKAKDAFLKHINFIDMLDEDIINNIKKSISEIYVADIISDDVDAKLYTDATFEYTPNIPNLKVGKAYSEALSQEILTNSLSDLSVKSIEDMSTQIAEGLLLRVKFLVINSLTAKTTFNKLGIQVTFSGNSPHVEIKKEDFEKEAEGFDLFLSNTHTDFNISTYSDLSFKQMIGDEIYDTSLIPNNWGVLIKTSKLSDPESFCFGKGIITESLVVNEGLVTVSDPVSYITQRSDEPLIQWGVIRGFPVINDYDFSKTVKIING